jgi:nucleotide-binding universal stress UspA family protein
MDLQRILVPLDGSELAERALLLAEQLARHSGGELILARAPLARVFTGMDAIAETDAETRALAEAHEYLLQVAERLDRAGVRNRLSIVSGGRDEPDPVIGQVVRPRLPFRELANIAHYAAEAIAGEAQAREADLIVMATHGRSGLGRWVYGSVALEVLQRATIPILLVRSGSPGTLPEGEALRILVPLDGTALGETALPPAVTLARLLGGSLVLVRAIPALQRSGLSLWIGPLVVDPVEHTALEAAARSYLDSIRDALADQGVTAVVVVAEGDTPIAVTEATREHGCGLVALATHGRAGLSKLAIGSRAEAIITTVPAPVLVVRPTEVVEGERVLPPAESTLDADVVIPELLPVAEPAAATAGEKPAARPIAISLSPDEHELILTALATLLQTERRDAHLGEPIQHLVARLEEARATASNAPG